MHSLFTRNIQMKKIKIDALALITIATLLIPFTAGASTPCNVLSAGNEHYSKDDIKAIDIYKTVEDIDKLGKDRCTASIYATIGTIYKAKGDGSSSHEAAVVYYRLSSKYNRAFATALMCHGGDCKASIDLWETNSFWSK